MFPGAVSAGKYSRGTAIASVLNYAAATGGSVTLNGMASAATGTMVANEYKTIVDVSGRGDFYGAGGYLSGVDGTIGLRVTMDGAVFYEGSVATGANGNVIGVNVALWVAGSASWYQPSAVVIPFASGLKIEALHSTTNSFTAYYAYTVSK